MGIIRITEKDKVTNLASDSVMLIQEYQSGVITVVLKPVKMRDENNPTLVVDYCQGFDFKAIEPVEFFNV